MLLAIAAIGVAVGFLGGLFGKGGSAVATPLLCLAGVPALAAVASPLPATVPGTLVAADSYRGAGLIDRRIVGWSLAIGVPATLLGAFATRWISGSALVVITEIVIVGIGLRIVLRRDKPEVVDADHELSRNRVLAVGGMAGGAAGLLANSGGFLLAPLYLTITHLPIKRSLASSLAVSAALAIPGTLVHVWLGHIDWTVACTLMATSIPASRTGARVALRTQSTQLERIYGFGLAVLGIALLAIR